MGDNIVLRFVVSLQAFFKKTWKACKQSGQVDIERRLLKRTLGFSILGRVKPKTIKIGIHSFPA